jgi:UDP-N-acetyl-D-glucosamine dehydrogenase
MYLKKLLNKVKKKFLNIGVIGVGYVGIKLILAFSKGNNLIYCFDNDIKKINILKKKKSPFSYINDLEIKKVYKHLNLKNKLNNISKCDAIIVCLPTPLKNGKPDLTHIQNSWKNIKPYLKKGQIIILESTTYPGCTEDIFLEYLKKKFNLGKEFFLSYSPERENPGDKKFNFRNTPKVISGIDRNSLKICKMIYSMIVNKVISAKSIKTAEASKLLENIYRSINIALINELKIACDNLNLDIYEIINLASTKPFGFSKFLPGPGTGGHCIPIDPIYFSWLSEKKGFKVKFIKLSAKINSFRTNWIISNIKKLIKKKNMHKILLIGLAYKKNIEDTRESASIKIFESLKNNKKKTIDYYDPYIKKHKFFLKNKNIIINSVNYNTKTFEQYDVIILATDHDKIDYKKLLSSKKILIDLRGKFRNKKKYKNIFNF